MGYGPNSRSGIVILWGTLSPDEWRRWACSVQGVRPDLALQLLQVADKEEQYRRDRAIRLKRRLPKKDRPRCGAQTRIGQHCQAPAVAGRKRCRLHGGLSTGPRTQEGRRRIADANRRRAISPGAGSDVRNAEKC